MFYHQKVAWVEVFADIQKFALRAHCMHGIPYTTYAQCLQTVYSGKRVRAQCLQTMHSVYMYAQCVLSLGERTCAQCLQIVQEVYHSMSSAF